MSRFQRHALSFDGDRMGHPHPHFETFDQVSHKFKGSNVMIRCAIISISNDIVHLHLQVEVGVSGVVPVLCPCLRTPDLWQETILRLATDA